MSSKNITNILCWHDGRLGIIGTIFACISAMSNFTNMEIYYETLWT